MPNLDFKELFIFFALFLFLLARVFFAEKQKLQEGKTVKITTTVLSQPAVVGSSQYLKFRNLKIYLPLYPEIFYGDKIVVVGVVRGEKLEKAKLLAHSQGSNFFFRARRKFLEIYKRSLPADEAALLAGVTIGSKALIGPDFWQKLKNSGTAHVVVASGMNVALVAGMLMSVAISFVRRGRAVIFVIAGIWIYAFFCGLEAPIIRAAIMGTIGFLAQFYGRVSNSFRSLVAAAYLMLVFNPAWTKDTGFLLSFAATASLILFSKKVESFTAKFKISKKVPKVFFEGFNTSLAAQIGVMPVLFLTFGRMNALSIVINTLTLWVIPILTVVGFLGGLVGILSVSLGKAVLFVVYPLARYFTLMVDIFG